MGNERWSVRKSLLFIVGASLVLWYVLIWLIVAAMG